jgi:hypothetical protein
MMSSESVIERFVGLGQVFEVLWIRSLEDCISNMKHCGSAIRSYSWKVTMETQTPLDALAEKTCSKQKDKLLREA